MINPDEQDRPLDSRIKAEIRRQGGCTPLCQDRSGHDRDEVVLVRPGYVVRSLAGLQADHHPDCPHSHE